MRVTITADSNLDSGVGEVVNDISGPTRNHFLSRNYGAGLPGLCVVLMCRDPALAFKRRIRHSKRDQTLYMDIMLPLSDMMAMDHHDRRRFIEARLKQEVPEVISKYRFKDFDQRGFTNDLCSWLDRAAA